MAQISWRLAGPQGSGIDTASSLFAGACAAAGLSVFGRREYHSNIIGRHSYYDVCAGAEPVTCHSQRPEIVVTFEAEALCRHASCTADGGLLCFASEDASASLTRLAYLDEPVRERIATALLADGRALSAAGLLGQAEARGVRLCEIPYQRVLDVLRAENGLPKREAERMRAVLAVSVCAAVLGVPPGLLRAVLGKLFVSRRPALALNLRTMELGYEFAERALEPLPTWRSMWSEASLAEVPMLVNATQSVALGKLASGLAFQTYYPISPATDESTFLEAHPEVPLKTGARRAPLVVQTEDELSAITMACGAALTGARCATATSGPGFSLMAEGLGWAGMSEVPVVVSLYQRGGPSTGMPTRTEQGDLLFAICGGHGEAPRMVLASGDVEECFYDSAQAFNYAERYQMPLVHLIDKALASTVQTIKWFDCERIDIERDVRSSVQGEGQGTWRRFALTATGVSPRAVLGQKGQQHWNTGVEHNELGLPTEDPTLRERMMEKRAQKLNRVLAELTPDEKLRVYGTVRAQFTLLTWGSNKGAALEALGRLLNDGVKARVIQVRLLWPFPARELMALLAEAGPVVVVEANFSGQFGLLLRQQTGLAPDYEVVKYNGRPISGDALYAAACQICRGVSQRRVVLRNPFE